MVLKIWQKYMVKYGKNLIATNLGKMVSKNFIRF
jgi:hypothetical protein